jgi:acyl carrier protein
MEPSAIGDDTPLFRDGLGLDSVDAIELVAAIERAYGIVITNEGKAREAFQNVGTLADFIVHEGGRL